MKNKINIFILLALFLAGMAAHSSAMELNGIKADKLGPRAEKLLKKILPNGNCSLETLKLRTARIGNDFSVSIRDEDGNMTGIVELSDPSIPTTNIYRVRVDLSHTLTLKANVIILFVHANNPHKVSIFNYGWDQYFSDVFGPYFSISDWEGTNLEGYGLVLVTTNWNGLGTLVFQIIKEE